MPQQLPYFYEPTLTAATQSFTLSEATSRHCIQVLRMQQEDLLQLTDGKGLLLTAKIAIVHKKHCGVTVTKVETFSKRGKNICIAISPTKNNGRTEWLLEKITEIGISVIYLLQCERTERTMIKWERLNHILISAMLQSRQVFLPTLSPLKKYKDVVSTADFDEKYIAHCVEQDKKQLLSNTDREVSKIILIGPEGDFSEEEIAWAITQQYVPVSLGDTRLRTETAGLVAAVLLSF